MSGNEIEKEEHQRITIVYTYSESEIFEIAFGKFGNFVYRTEQKQPSRGVLRKRCSENMQQIYRRIPMPKCDFNKFAKQLC